MKDVNELTVIAVRKPDVEKYLSSGEAFRLIRPLLETNGLYVGDAIDLADGFLFPISPRGDAWDDTERNAIAAGVTCLGSLGFTGYIAQEVSVDGLEIDTGTVALGLAGVAVAAVLAVGVVLAGVGGIRAVGRRLGARRGL